MIRIAIFDDYEDTLHLIADHFKDAGITDFALYDNYKEFIDDVDHNTDICLIDYSINGIPYNGIDIMRQVFGKAPSCRVIMMSAFLDVRGLTRCINNGAKMAVDKSDDNWLDDITHFIKNEMPVIEMEHRLRNG